jgi:hypothetical protein
MRINELTSILRIAADAGAEKALAGCGNAEAGITKAVAYRAYGRGNIDRWLQEKLIHVSEKKINRLNLERIAAASNRITYLPVAER